MTNNSLRSYALDYASKGWRVLPLHTVKEGICSCGKASCNSKGKHPRTHNGVKGATTDVTRINMYWGKWPDANIGIATGRESGLVVLDVDAGHGGVQTLDVLLRENEDISTLKQHTGGGGFHFLFKCPVNDGVIKNSVGRLGIGLDVRAEGGYIVAPPSVHASGNSYAWESEPKEAALSDVPGWLLKLISSKSENRDSSDSRKILEGSRNNEMTRLAGRMKSEGKSNQEIKIALLEENRLSCYPPLDDAEVIKIASSIAKYSQKDKPLLFRWRESFLSENGPQKTDGFRCSGATTRYVLLALSTHMNLEGRSCYPTIKQLAKETGLSEGAIKQCLTKADVEGWIERYEYQGEGQAWRNHGYIAKLPSQ